MQIKGRDGEQYKSLDEDEYAWFHMLLFDQLSCIYGALSIYLERRRVRLHRAITNAKAKAKAKIPECVAFTHTDFAAFYEIVLHTCSHFYQCK